METHTISQYIHLGAIHWYLVDLPLKTKIGGKHSVLEAITDLKGNLDKAGLQIAMRAGSDLWELAEEIREMPAEDEAEDSLIIRIRALAREIERTMIAEAAGKMVYLVTEKRLDVDKLLNAPHLLLADRAFLSLPAISARDFSLGCKAIAFELPTAAAFHLLRCVEGALGNYYQCAIKRNRLPDKHKMWGPMIDQLRSKKTNKVPVELLDTLDRIRVNFRNPTNHPEKEYDTDEAQDLFGLCVDALNRLVKDTHWKRPDDCFGVRMELAEKQEAEAKASGNGP